MKKYIITAIALATLLIGSVTFTACEDIDDIHELSLNRLLSPTNLIGKINSKVNITASWDAVMFTLLMGCHGQCHSLYY